MEFGPLGIPMGRGRPLLLGIGNKVMVLGTEALRYSTRLAHSPQSSARFAAISGLAELNTSQAERLVRTLTKDKSHVRVYQGCVGFETSVGDHGKDTLRHPFEKPRLP